MGLACVLRSEQSRGKQIDACQCACKTCARRAEGESRAAHRRRLRALFLIVVNVVALVHIAVNFVVVVLVVVVVVVVVLLNRNKKKKRNILGSVGKNRRTRTTR